MRDSAVGSDYRIGGYTPVAVGGAEYGAAPIPPGSAGIAVEGVCNGGNGAVAIPVTVLRPCDACVSGGGLDQSISGLGTAVAVAGNGVVSDVIR